MTTRDVAAGPAVSNAIELDIDGMTCASCANRIERKLNKLEGVTATVNYATEKAKVSYPEGFDPGLLVAEVEKAGYRARLPVPPRPRPAETEPHTATGPTEAGPHTAPGSAGAGPDPTVADGVRTAGATWSSEPEADQDDELRQLRNR